MRLFRRNAFCTYNISNFITPYENDAESDIEVNELPPKQLRLAENDQDLMAIISEHIDPKVLMEIYMLNKPLYGQQHYMLTVRIIAHFLGMAKSYSHDHTFRSCMNEMANYLEKEMPALSSVDLLELLFFKSKYNQKSVGLLLEKLHEKQIERAINRRLKEFTDFSLRHYINIWYDSQLLNIEIPRARNIVLERLHMEPLSATEAVLLLRCELVRQQKKKLVTQDLVEFCIQHFLDNKLCYDFQQCTSFYTILLKMKYQYFSPLVDATLIYKELRKSLINNLKRIDEHCLINIVQNYELLPKEISPDLELKIKEYMLKQLNNMPHKISVQLISQYIFYCAEQCSSQEIDLMIDAIVDRLQLETHLHSLTQANRIGQQMLHLRNAKLSINSRIKLAVFSEYVIQTCKIGYPEYGIMYLRYVCGLEVDNLITEESALKHPFSAYATITSQNLKSSLHQLLLNRIRENPIKSLQEMARLHQEEYPFKNLTQIVILEFFRKPQEKYLGLLLRLIADQKLANTFKECLQSKKNDMFRLALRQYPMNKLLVQNFGNLLIQHIERFNETQLLNIVTSSSLTAEIAKNHPERMATIISDLKSHDEGLAVLSFCKYLVSHNVNIKECLHHAQKNARLDALYKRYQDMCVENKLIILYILYFN